MSFFYNHNKTTTTTTSSSSTTTTTRITIPSKKALCVGINNYPDPANRLSGCFNDANDWAAYLSGYKGFDIRTLIDSQATSTNFKEIFGNYIAESKAGDYLVCSYSGHGSNLPDQNGDEPDGRDECICLYDRFFIDDELRAMFVNIHPETTVVFISDSCFSGSVTRAFLNAINNSEERLKPRYLPPQDDVEARNIINSKIKNRMFYPESGMNEILISGCSNTEYSYDAYVNGRNNGAMTAFALQVLKQNNQITFNDFYVKLRTLLPSSKYPQTPALEGSESNKSKLMFE